MAPQTSPDVSSHRSLGPDATPRLRLKRKAPVSGHVDGAWWPHSDVLSTELPDLLAVLSVRLGVVARVMYNIDEWQPAPRRMVNGDRTIRLDGYHRQPTNTLEVLDGLGNRIVLLVVPAHTDPDRAHAILMAAASADDATSVESLLGVGGAPVPADHGSPERI
jgi:Family of unknown function (DUF5994)